MKCNTTGCPNPAVLGQNYCQRCMDEIKAMAGRKVVPIKSADQPKQPEPTKQPESSGGDNDYWLIPVPDPKRLSPYIAETEDLIEALEMTFQEGEAFKAIIRKCQLRLGKGKPGDTEIRNAEKTTHYGIRMIAMEKRKLLKQG